MNIQLTIKDDATGQEFVRQLEALNQVELINIQRGRLTFATSAAMRKQVEAATRARFTRYSIKTVMLAEDEALEECTICEEDMNNPFAMTCGHLFCNECVPTSQQCPQCY